MLVLHFTPHPYVPRKLTTLNEVLAVLFFALAAPWRGKTGWGDTLERF
jgi:hypothetical protein